MKLYWSWASIRRLYWSICTFGIAIVLLMFLDFPGAIERGGLCLPGMLRCIDGASLGWSLEIESSCGCDYQWFFWFDFLNLLNILTEYNWSNLTIFWTILYHRPKYFDAFRLHLEQRSNFDQNYTDFLLFQLEFERTLN